MDPTASDSTQLYPSPSPPCRAYNRALGPWERQRLAGEAVWSNSSNLPARRRRSQEFAAVLSLLLVGSWSASAQLPPNWSDQDIGSPSLAGSASYANGTFTVSGGGSDIWNNADQFHFAYNAFGGSAVVALVNSIDNTDPWAKAGVMFRDTLDPASMFADVVISPGQGVSFQWRNSTGGSCGLSQITGISAPIWVKLVQVGTDFTGFYSADGVTWNQIGSDQIITMNNTPLAGLAVTAHNDTLLANASFANVVISNAPAPPAIVFGIYRELWDGLNSSLGNTLAALTNTTDNPNWPDNPNPAYTEVFTIFETEVNTGMNYYGQRLRAFVVPPTNGNYTFWIASDDTSDLFLSTDETPAHKKYIAGVATWTSSRQWSKEAGQQSAPVALEAGRRYYIEAIMQQGTGGDNLAVRWELPDGSFEEPMQAASSAGTLMIPFTGIDSEPAIYQQTTNVTVVEGYNAFFSVSPTNQAPVSYQWYLNGNALSGPLAVKPFYWVSNASIALNNGQVYTCAISNSVDVITSAAMTLSVIPDTVPPKALSAVNLGTNSVQVVFSKPLEAASATNRANYVFTNGLAISAASLASDNVTVVLKTAPLVYGSNYTVLISGVRDRASTPNTIAANSPVSFTALPYVPQDIGNPSIPSVVTLTTNGLNITAAGSDIGGQIDQANLSYQLRTGDFDISVQLAELSPSDPWAKAGLMARETLSRGARFAASLATPSMTGCFFEWRDPASSQANLTGRFPVNYPNTWLRLKRAANLFTGFASYDGLTWTSLGSATILLPSQLYVGLVASSHNINEATTALFQNVGTVTNAVVGTVPNPHEPLGPCSRLTPFVISEIMYKPAPRTDGNNVEFIELYNSNPYFEDLSGFQIAGSISYTFPAGTILNGGAFLVLAASPAGIQNVYGITNVIGPYTGSLKKSGTIQLLDAQGGIVLTVPYSNLQPWPISADGTGHSLVLANPTYGEGDPRAWDISDVVGGSPGEGDAFRPNPLRSVVINEVLAHSENPSVLQFIELYNHSIQTNDLSGCILTDDPVTNKFVLPQGTLIGPGGFVSFNQTQLGFTLNGAGGNVFFIKPDRSHVLDAVQFEPEADGVSYGRWPDGASDFYPLAARTPGSSNSGIWIGDIVINELMYAPISGNDDDQYIELYNKGTNTVNLANWRFSSGISLVFPANITLAPNAYLVLARNQTNLFAKYPNLNAANTLGNYGGKLSHKGERLALEMPQLLTVSGTSGTTTNTIYVVEDEVTYAAGGRWGQWSHGGGSSLELINPNTNHRLAYNWADSDETAKSVWTNLEFTGVLDNGANYNGGVVDLVQLGLLDVGECLVDNIEVLPGGPTGANIVSNATFETGLSPWVAQGDHIRSSIEKALGGYQSATSLHLRSSDGIWTLADYVQGVLTDTSLAAGQTATLRLKARWLRGWPEILMRLRGNWLEVTGAMPLPTNLGTPGLPNSRAVPHAGPAIYEVKHSPAIPAANQAVMVSARFHELGSFQPTLLYRVDKAVFNPSPTYTSVAMLDNGIAGDALAGDGIYSATIPAQPGGTVVAFLVQARDSTGATTVFPQVLNNNTSAPRECVVAFGDPIPTGSFAHHHVFITYNWAQLWSQGGGVSHEVYDGTWVDGGGRIVYNWMGRYAGSPYHQYLGSPVTTVGGMHWLMPDDDQVFGTASFNKQHVPGNGPLDDNTLQREQTAYWMARQIGLHFQNRRYYFSYVNGVRHAPLMEDSQVPDAAMLKQIWPNDNNGMLYKNHSWFEGATMPQANAYMNFNNVSWCNLGSYTTTINGVPNQYKKARYRWIWWVRQFAQSADDFSQLFALIDAANTPTSSPAYYDNMESQVDTEEWLRLSAMEHATGDWDSFFTQNQWNMYCYKPTMGKWTALKWDWNITLGSGTQTWPPDGSQLFNFTVHDPIMAAFHNYPAYQRAYLRALQDIANMAMNNALVNPVLDAKYAAFAANGLTVNANYGIQVAEPGNAGLKNWIGTMHNSILTALANQGVSSIPFAINSQVVNNDVAVISGTAPLAVKTVWFNGEEFPLTWSSFTSWTATVPLKPGTNQFSVVGVDLHSQPVAGSSNSVSVVYSGALPSPTGPMVFNEIMYNPTVPGAQYIELYNASPTITFDMSGWQLQSLGYTFPPGSLIAPNGFQVLVANRSAFSAAYGGTIPIFDEFAGTLSASGQTLFLMQPGTNSTGNLVAAVRYGAGAPWPSGANGSGSSLQLIDPNQDNWRVGNWASSFPPASFSPGAVNTVAASLPAFPPLWLNELQSVNLTGITNSAGQHVPWLELYNPTTNAVSLSGLSLSTNYANLNAWTFPNGATINPGEFKVIFADAQTSLSTPNQPHTSFTLSSSSGSLALSRLYNGQPQVLDYIDYTNLGPNHSYGSVPDGQSFFRQELALATPGGTNNNAIPPSFIAYTTPGAVYTQNFDSLPDPGATSVNSANPVTINGITYSLANPFGFSDFVLASGNGGLGISELAGWYGLASLTSKFGATDGDQTTGGQISFGLPGSANRALGLLATSSTGGTAFGARFINQTPQSLNSISVQVTGELWRQSNLPKTLQCYYFIDPTGTAPFSSSQTGLLPALNVNFVVNAAAVGGTAVDGTASATQTNLTLANQSIASWPPGAALWLAWQMTDSTGKAQALAIDNLSFSASTQSALPPLPLSFQTTTTNVILSWPGATGETYQLQYKDDLGASAWTPLGAPVPGTGAAISFTNDFTKSSQRFYRLQIIP